MENDVVWVDDEASDNYMDATLVQVSHNIFIKFCCQVMVSTAYLSNH